MVVFDNLLYTSPERASAHMMSIRKQLRDCADARVDEMRDMVEQIDGLVSTYGKTCMGFTHRSANIYDDLRCGRYTSAYDALRRLHAAEENVTRAEPVPALRFA